MCIVFGLLLPCWLILFSCSGWGSPSTCLSFIFTLIKEKTFLPPQKKVKNTQTYHPPWKHQSLWGILHIFFHDCHERLCGLQLNSKDKQTSGIKQFTLSIKSRLCTQILIFCWTINMYCWFIRDPKVVKFSYGASIYVLRCHSSFSSQTPSCPSLLLFLLPSPFSYSLLLSFFINFLYAHTTREQKSSHRERSCEPCLLRHLSLPKSPSPQPATPGPPSVSNYHPKTRKVTVGGEKGMDGVWEEMRSVT